MTFSNSFFFTDTLVDALTNGIALAINSDTWKVALFSSSCSSDGAADTASAAYGFSPYDSDEVTGTNWASGGTTLSGTSSFLAASSGTLKFDATDVSVSSTTLSNAHGCLIYDSTISDRALLAITFGADYSTSNGTFGITWDSSGIAVIDVTP